MFRKVMVSLQGAQMQNILLELGLPADDFTIILIQRNNQIDIYGEIYVLFFFLLSVVK
jgi:hypothetical protein